MKILLKGVMFGLIILTSIAGLCFSATGDLNNDQHFDLKDIIAGLQILSGENEQYTSTKPAYVMINVGDSLTNGVQSYLCDETTQIYGFTQVLFKQISQVTNLTWKNPLLQANGVRKDMTVIPYNLGVAGATIKQIVSQKTNIGNPYADNPLLTQLMLPIPSFVGHDVTQLEAAEYLASLHPDKPKIITLWVGNNDILRTVLVNGGTGLTETYITSFINDTAEGHDMNSIETNFSTLVNRLRAIPNSSVFIATLPLVTNTGTIFNKSDLERLARFPQPNVTTLENGEAIGIVPFQYPTLNTSGNLPDTKSSVAAALTTDNTKLNEAIARVKATDAWYLSAQEISIINSRVVEINSYIESVAGSYTNVFIVDTYGLFNSVVNDGIIINGRSLTKTLGGGIFSIDGVHLSHTGYAFIANAFIGKMNESLNLQIPLENVGTVMTSDPYIDKDGDGFIAGPYTNRAILYPTLRDLPDCNDNSSQIYSPVVHGVVGSDGKLTCPTK